MAKDLSDPAYVIKLLKIELADERELTAERQVAVLKLLDHIIERRGDPAAVVDLAVTAKNVLMNGWI